MPLLVAAPRTYLNPSEATFRNTSADRVHLAEPPAVRLLALAAKAKTVTCTIFGSNTAKVGGGFMIGLGIAFSWTGIGIGFIVVGAALLAVSTALSTANLEQKNGFAIVRHLAWSLLLGTAGACSGLLHLGAGAGYLAALSPRLAEIAIGLELLAAAGPITDILDSGNSCSIRNSRQEPVLPDDPNWSDQGNDLDSFIDLILSPRGQLLLSLASQQLAAAETTSAEQVTANDLDSFIDLILSPRGRLLLSLASQQLAAAETTSAEQVTAINLRLSGMFSEAQPTAIRYQPNTGTQVTLNMDGGQDLVTYESIAGSTAEWIAVMRQANPAIYDVMLNSTYERLMTGDNSIRLATGRHPISRIPISDELTVRGQELLTLLNTTTPPVITT